MRKGSKGIKDKNLLIINKKPLMSYTINSAKKSKLFDKIFISSDCKKILTKAKNYNVDGYLRPKNMAKDSSPKIPAIRHALLFAEKKFKKKYDVIFDLDITSPLRNISDIKNSYKKFINEKAKNLITVCESKKNPYFNMVELKKNSVKIIKKSKMKITRRQDAPKTYDMNASIYIWKRDILLKSNNLFSNKTSCYIMPQDRSVDIDNFNDLNIVKSLIK